MCACVWGYVNKPQNKWSNKSVGPFIAINKYTEIFQMQNRKKKIWLTKSIFSMDTFCCSRLIQAVLYPAREVLTWQVTVCSGNCLPISCLVWYPKKLSCFCSSNLNLNLWTSPFTSVMQSFVSSSWFGHCGRSTCKSLLQQYFFSSSSKILVIAAGQVSPSDLKYAVSALQESVNSWMKREPSGANVTHNFTPLDANKVNKCPQFLSWWSKYWEVAVSLKQVAQYPQRADHKHASVMSFGIRLLALLIVGTVE